MTENQIGDEGIPFFTDMLKFNTTLITLKLKRECMNDFQLIQTVTDEHTDNLFKIEKTE